MDMTTDGRGEGELVIAVVGSDGMEEICMFRH